MNEIFQAIFSLPEAEYKRAIINGKLQYSDGNPEGTFFYSVAEVSTERKVNIFLEYVDGESRQHFIEA